ncbi:MAG: ROK family protein [Dehalococcoidia bacterium]
MTPAKGSETSPSDRGVLVADLGGSQLRVAVFDGAGEIRHKTSVETPPGRPAALGGALSDAKSSVDLEVLGAVVGVPGPVDYQRGEVGRLPNLPAWEGRVSARLLADTLGLPVILANDADLGALGEHRSGAGRGVADMVYLAVGTGVGAGVVTGGRLLHGRWSLAEAGHMVIDRASGGTVEALGAGPALRRLTGEDAERVVMLAGEGDGQALAAMAQVAEALAIGLLNLLYCFMPQRAVIGGGLAQAGALLLDPIREQVARRGAGLSLDAAEIVLGEHGSDAGLVGGGALGVDAFLAGAGSSALQITRPRVSPG